MPSRLPQEPHVQHGMDTPAGVPPFTNAGGIQGIDPSATAYLHLDLTPGNYVAIRHIPDPASGNEHAVLGTVIPFTIK